MNHAPMLLVQRVVAVAITAALAAAASGCTPSAEKPLRPIAQKPEMVRIPSGWLVQRIVKKCLLLWIPHTPTIPLVLPRPQQRKIPS